MDTNCCPNLCVLSSAHLSKGHTIPSTVTYGELIASYLVSESLRMTEFGMCDPKCVCNQNTFTQCPTQNSVMHVTRDHLQSSLRVCTTIDGQNAHTQQEASSGISFICCCYCVIHVIGGRLSDLLYNVWVSIFTTSVFGSSNFLITKYLGRHAYIMVQRGIIEASVVKANVYHKATFSPIPTKKNKSCLYIDTLLL